MKINTLLRDIIDNFSISALLMLAVFSFIYGVLHSMGPGHGKSLVFSYFLKDEQRLKKSLSLAALISVIHTGAAIILAFLLYFVFTGIKGMFRIKMQGYFMGISGVTIVVVGLTFMLVKIFKKNKKEKLNDKHSPSKGNVLAVGFSAGMVPCPAALMIMLLTLSRGAIVAGFVSVISISLGMFILLSLIGLLSIKSRSGILSVSGKFVSNTEIIAEVLEFVSIILIMMIGVFMALPFVQLLFR